MSLKQQLTHYFKTAIVAALGKEFSETDPIIKVSGRPEFGDYQANFAMSLGKQLGKAPREVAQQVQQHLGHPDVFAKLEVAGPGFINIHLQPAFIAQQLLLLANDKHCGAAVAKPDTVVIDYGGPNVAKEMHVGHLRSTVIGDSLVRVLEFLGHKVIRQNHLGDWGTQFGMLIQNLLDQDWQAGKDHTISDLNAMYQAAKKRYDDDEEFAKRARERVVLLQSGDAETLKLWQYLVTESERHFELIYKRLGVLLTQADIKGESSYNPLLANTVAELQKSGLAETSEGAVVIFLDGFKDQDDKALPFIIQKTDGGYLYATTDLAAMKYRLKELKADRLVYVIDARQKQHLAMLFAATRKQGWADDSIRLEHAAFGTVLGADHRPFKTRTGETIKLVDLLDDAEERALAIIQEKNADLPLKEQQAIAQAVSVSAIKYADLSSDRVKDYVFDWSRMLSFDGNSAPYLLNAYVRIQSIFRKGNVDVAHALKAEMVLVEPAETKLALALLAFPDVVQLVTQDLAPHYLCHYLCDLAASYHSFYEHCPILQAEDTAIRNSRLALCAVTARVLKTGLNLLGIATIDRM